MERVVSVDQPNNTPSENPRSAVAKRIGLGLASLALSGCSFFPSSAREREDATQEPERRTEIPAEGVPIEPLWRKSMEWSFGEEKPHARIDPEKIDPEKGERLGTGPELPSIPDVGTDKSPARIRREYDGEPIAQLDQLRWEIGLEDGGDFRQRVDLSARLRLSESGELSFSSRNDVTLPGEDIYRGRHVIGVGPSWEVGKLPLLGEPFKLQAIGTAEFDDRFNEKSYEGGLRFSLRNGAIDITTGDDRSTLAGQYRIEIGEGFSARLFQELNFSHSGDWRSETEAGIDFRLDKRSILFTRLEVDDFEMGEARFVFGVGLDF